jgi:hypothetical protein
MPLYAPSEPALKKNPGDKNLQGLESGCIYQSTILEKSGFIRRYEGTLPSLQIYLAENWALINFQRTTEKTWNCLINPLCK